MVDRDAMCYSRTCQLTMFTFVIHVFSFISILSLIFGENISITPSIDLCCHQIIFFSLNLINPIELYAFTNETNLPLAKFINQ